MCDAVRKGERELLGIDQSLRGRHDSYSLFLQQTPIIIHPLLIKSCTLMVAGYA